MKISLSVIGIIVFELYILLLALMAGDQVAYALVGEGSFSSVLYTLHPKYLAGPLIPFFVFLFMEIFLIMLFVSIFLIIFIIKKRPSWLVVSMFMVTVIQVVVYLSSLQSRLGDGTLESGVFPYVVFGIASFPIAAMFGMFTHHLTKKYKVTQNART